MLPASAPILCRHILQQAGMLEDEMMPGNSRSGLHHFRIWLFDSLIKQQIMLAR